MLDMRSTAHTVCSERPLIGATRLFMVVVVESTAVYGFYSWARGWELGALKQLGRALVQLVVCRRSRQQRSREGGGGELREKCFIDVCAIALVSAHRPAAPPPPPTPARARAPCTGRRTSSSTTCSYAYAPTTCCCALVEVRALRGVVRARPPRVPVVRVAEERGVLDLLERAGVVAHGLRPARRAVGASDLGR